MSRGFEGMVDKYAAMLPDPLPVPVPDGQVGAWKVSSFTLTESDVLLPNLRAIRDGVPELCCKPGEYKRLTRNGTVVMSNTPMEVKTNMEFINKAKGQVLIMGLGLGMALHAILQKAEVSRVVVIEVDEDVVRLVGPTFGLTPDTRHVDPKGVVSYGSPDGRLCLVVADALTWQPPKGVAYDTVWHDIWDEICADNLPQMATLSRRYARRAGWQGFWAKRMCQRQSRY